MLTYFSTSDKSTLRTIHVLAPSYVTGAIAPFVLCHGVVPLLRISCCLLTFWNLVLFEFLYQLWRFDELNKGLPFVSNSACNVVHFHVIVSFDTLTVSDRALPCSNMSWQHQLWNVLNWSKKKSSGSCKRFAVMMHSLMFLLRYRLTSKRTLKYIKWPECDIQLPQSKATWPQNRNTFTDRMGKRKQIQNYHKEMKINYLSGHSLSLYARLPFLRDAQWPQTNAAQVQR